MISTFSQEMAIHAQKLEQTKLQSRNFNRSAYLGTVVYNFNRKSQFKSNTYKIKINITYIFYLIIQMKGIALHI